MNVFSRIYSKKKVFSFILRNRSSSTKRFQSSLQIPQIRIASQLILRMSWNPYQGPLPPGSYPPGNFPPTQGGMPYYPNQTTVTTTTTQVSNPYRITLIPINFDPSCKKCRGTGIIVKNGQNTPCKRCYKHCGYCRKCYGSRINYYTGQPCTYCLNGRYIYDKKMRKQLQKMSEVSSDSDG